MIDGQVDGADGLLEGDKKPNVADREKEEVRDAIKAAEKDANEMHMQTGATSADDTPEGRTMARDAAAKRARERQASLSKEGYIAGIGIVKHGAKGKSWYSGLFEHHRVPLKVAKQALARSAQGGSSVPASFTRQQPSAWAVANKETSGALGELSTVGEGVAKEVGGALVPLTQDRGVHRQASGQTPLGQFFGF